MGIWRFIPLGRDRWLREHSPLAQRQSEPTVSEANAGTPDNYRDCQNALQPAIAHTKRVLGAGLCRFNFVIKF
jgi:hypothetical protein